jgi:sirohydrochlorin cobaltochelatase
MSAPSLSDVAVVLAAHGDRGGEAPNATLLAHRDALAATRLFRSVAAGALRAENLPLEEALQQAHASGAARIVVYPMFMADGYFTGKVLPERIAAAGLTDRCTLLQPLGLDPQLPNLMMNHALAMAGQTELTPHHTRLLIVGHGSKIGRASLRSTERVACKIRKMQQFSYVETAYLEEAPFLGECLKSSLLTTLVLGFFSGDGMHAAEDVPGAIAEAGADAHYAGSVGRQPQIAGIIEAAVRTAVVASSPA